MNMNITSPATCVILIIVSILTFDFAKISLIFLASLLSDTWKSLAPLGKTLLNPISTGGGGCFPPHAQ